MKATVSLVEYIHGLVKEKDVMRSALAVTTNNANNKDRMNKF